MPLEYPPIPLAKERLPYEPESYTSILMIFAKSRYSKRTAKGYLPSRGSF